jgi:hypothetical protein
MRFSASAIALLGLAVVLAVSPAAEALRAAAFGDLGVTPQAEANVAHADGRSYLGLGDYHYEASFEDWEAMMEPLLQQGGYLTLGNHDNASDVVRYTPGHVTPWSTVVDGVLFIGLDTQQPLHAGSPQRAWLVQQLARDVPMKVVLMHKPWWLGAAAHHPGTEFPGDPAAMDSLMRRYGVDLVLAGHEHNYQRAVRTGGIQHAIVGTGGYSLYPVQGQAAGTVASCSCFGLLRATIEPGLIRAAFDRTSPSIATLDTFSAGPTREFWALQAEDASVKTTGGLVTSPSYSKGKAWNLWTNGHIAHATSNAFERNVTLVIRATGTEAGGIEPRMVAHLGGVQVGAWDVEPGVLKDYKAKVRLPAGSPELRVAFTNDAVIGGADRNLIVDRFALFG